MSERTKADEAWEDAKGIAYDSGFGIGHKYDAIRLAVQAEISEQVVARLEALDNALDKRVEELEPLDTGLGHTYCDTCGHFHRPEEHTTEPDPTPAREGMPVVAEAEISEDGTYRIRGELPPGKHPLVRLEDAERVIGDLRVIKDDLAEMLSDEIDKRRKANARIRELEAELEASQKVEVAEEVGRVINLLETAKKAATLENAGFGFPDDRIEVKSAHFGDDNRGRVGDVIHPTVYVRNITRLHHATWIIGPLNEAIKLMTATLTRAAE